MAAWETESFLPWRWRSWFPAWPVGSVLRALLGLYPGYGLDPVERLRRQTYSVLAALAIFALFDMFFRVATPFSRLLLVATFLGLLFLAPIAQNVTQRALRRANLWGLPAMILGYKDAGVHIARLLEEEWTLGYNPVAVFNYRLAPSETLSEAEARSDVLQEVTRFARERGVDTVIFAMPHARREQLAPLVERASAGFRRVLVVPNLAGIVNSAAVARNLVGTFAVEIEYNLLDPWALRTKRVIDLVVTTVGTVLISPLLLIFAALVYLESGGPIFYADRRMAQDGKLFSCVKFRTMVPDAEATLARMLETDLALREEYLKYHKLRKDPRVTRVGRFLRRTSMDELPQLWNVLRGEMSLVGPRPYLPRESEEMGLSRSKILRVPPGMTGPWQVAGRNHTSFEERVNLDTYYVHDWSVWLDLVTLARTVKVVLRGHGAY